MARILFVAILAVCLVCVLQATPVPDQDQQPNAANQLQEIANQALQATQQGLNLTITTVQEEIQKLANNPNIQQFGQEMQKFLEHGAELVKGTIDKAIPTTGQ